MGKVDAVVIRLPSEIGLLAVILRAGRASP